MYQNGGSSRGGSEPDGATALVLGRYQLLGKLASGGMGEIHLARLRGEGGFEKLVVVKVLLPELARVESFESMFLDEARIAARLSHPNVCEVYELGRDGHRPYLVMQYLRGVPLTTAMKRQPDEEPAAHARLMASAIAQASAGLHHAHELRDSDGTALGVVHRDVSPSNLFVTTDGTVKVLDFGIAKAHGASTHTARDEIKGKYAYMSPEQIRGDVLDRRSDVFSLGIVLWEAMTGARLFQRGSDIMSAKAIIEEPIPRADHTVPEVGAVLADIAARALSRDRDARYADAHRLGEALRQVLAGEALEPALAARVRRRFAPELEAREASVRRATALAARLDAGASPLTGDTTRDLGPVRRRSWLVPVGGAAVVLGLAAAVLSARGCPSAPVVAGSVVDAGGRTDALAIAAPMIDAAIAVDVAPDATAAVPVPRVVRRPPARVPGRVSIDSTPYAIIYIDGVRAGVTPLIDHQVPPGKRRIRAVLENGKSQSFSLTIEEGKRAQPRHLYW
ncbi:MAG TPA: serine/threonine-protein kinase [Kofleriaceae bacterium]|nr:serine/threonine-protein kinase [Kofleriaceae bacterium]